MTALIFLALPFALAGGLVAAGVPLWVALGLGYFVLVTIIRGLTTDL